MRVLIVNKFFYNRGGAEVVAMNLRDLLIAEGHDVAVFTMEYHSNRQVENLFTAPEVTFRAGGLKAKLQFACRSLGLDVTKSFINALDSFRPDVVHLHNIHSYISPVVAKPAHERGCKVVWTLHDYKLLCPAYSCLNHGVPCEKCFKTKWHILSERCFKQDFRACALAYIEAKRWNRRQLEQWTDNFVCPSRFMREKMKAGGFKEDKLHVISNFIDQEKLEEINRQASLSEREDFLFYAGRMSSEKGIDTLLDVAANLRHKLVMAGDGPMFKQITERYHDADNIHFVGQLTPQEVTRYFCKAKAVIMPSECYENNPLSIIEARCAGAPIIGARIGGIPELIDRSCGLTFEAFNRQALYETINTLMTTDFDHRQIAIRAQEEFSAKKHMRQLMAVYND